MNVSIFNKFNHKSTVLDAMYSEWSSLPLEGGGQGVLATIGGKDVVLAVVKQLESSEPSPLTTDTEVEWVVEVLRYGLCLPLKEHEAVRGCVRVCCAWLSPLLGEDVSTSPPPPAVPVPVRNNPKHYAKKILLHLHNLFVPRPDEGGDLISKQAVLCHRVLRLARSLAGGSSLSESEWRALLVLLLSAAGSLLSPPAPHHPAADQLCKRVLCVLFEVWILACHRCFPTPPLWRTLREQCLRWRHRPALTDQWSRVSLCLTARLLTHMYGPDFPTVPVSEEDSNLIPPDMSAEAVMQSWYRILQTIGNPVDMCRPHLISDTPDFLQYSLTQEDGVQEPSQHPCLQALPSIFYRAMKGVAAHVDAFLGRGQYGWWTEGRTETTPPPLRGPTNSFSITSRQKDKHTDKSVSRSSIIGLTNRQVNVMPPTPPNSIVSQAPESEKPPLASLRPKVNSLFHLFGEWLFEAALIGTSTVNQSQRVEGTPPPPSIEAQRTNLVLYQQGRAEALGALCRVLCSKHCGEEVLAPYLARCYAAIHRGLRHNATVAAVVLNAQDIFRLDLDGVLVLVPDFLSALEKILPGKETIECDNKKELRKAAINVLLSMIAFPNQYKNLPVPEFPGSNDYTGMTISSLCRRRLALVCLSGLREECHNSLAVPLLSALYLTVLHNAHITSHKSHSYSETTTDHRARSESGDSLDESNAEALLRDLDPASPAFGAALVVQATNLVCHRLISWWKSHLQVSLAALDLLSGLAKLPSIKPDGTYYKRAVCYICDYITEQCERPPQAHSRDLHSCVVGAFLCLQHWLSPKLLADRECFEMLIEVVELGISGSKSQGPTSKPGDVLKLKDEKELKPVSMRVRDAAESLLMLIMEQSDTNLQGFTRCRLDERWLSELGHSKMRHFVVDGSIILSLLEEPLANSQEPQPTIIVLVRSGMGRGGWCVLTRGMPRSASCGSKHNTRTTSLHNSPTYPHVPMQPPELDSSFPSLDSVLRQLNDPNAPTLIKLLEQQANIEKKIRDSQRNYIPEECTPPQPVTEFQTARLFLSNFGYLNIGGDKKESRNLTALDSSKPSFYKALRNLDSCPVRTPVTVHCFFVRAKQTTVRQILSSAHDTNLPEAYVSMLRGLGKAVRVLGHAGWSGHVETSYDAKTNSEDSNEGVYETTPSVYDAKRQVLYWSDAISEIAFVVPSERSLNVDDENDFSSSDVDGICLAKCTEKSSVSSWDLSSSATPSFERSTSERASDKRISLSDTARAISLDLDRHPYTGVTGSGRKKRDYCTKILVIWLEDYEDHQNLPIDDLLPYCDTGISFRPSDVLTICISLCRGGAHMLSPSLSCVVSPSLLPHCVRRAALDADVRRRLHTDLYQPPHVRRRHLIQEIAQQYKKDLTEAELIESLFHPPL